jgi:hypothetical protein
MAIYQKSFSQCIIPTCSQDERIPLASEDEEDDEEIESSDSEDGAPEDERLQELRQRLATKVNIEDIYCILEEFLATLRSSITWNIR